MSALHRRNTRRAVLGLIGAGFGATAGCLGRSDADELTVGIIPDVDPETAIERNVPLADHLEAELGVAVDLRTTSDYASLVQSMVGEHVDVAYFGGVSYVLASRRADARAIAVGERDGTTEWESVVIGHEGSEIDAPGDLRDATDVDFVLGDPLSTTGSVMPTYYAASELDLDLETDVESHTHVGAHDAVLRTVANGDADAGALNARIFDSERDRGATDGAVEIWRTPSFANYPWAVGPTVGDELAEEIRQTFLTLHESVSADVLDRLNVDRYVEATHDDFAGLEEAVEFVGITDR